ncbi:hypothetical protein Ae717Ps2_6862c [Pseudonocardia sp. Ae717_Ps2]|uniref:hypothetical protein n=1 Tax=Pseudonocardia sp. Ae717_Ps2 TaxID=1885573 RepID=UPI00094AF10C|nr:hypothetical protein [Pseudonocardia sp. Ae717_Ps2]OLM28012.1 hypothetical protein Ae717Ps2_6862c [Pseudonocardia sp. Ae717_Ps2]
MEGTHTDLNGWHLHIHALLIFPTDVSAEIPALTCEVYTRWPRAGEEGMSATAEHGIDVRVGNGAVEKMGKYISKLAFETAGGRWKRGKRGSRTPFQILADAIDTGNERDVALWQEWEQGSHGMQQLVWSNASSSAAGHRVKDEEIAEEDGGGELAGVLPARSWKKIYPVAEDLIIATRHGGVPAARAWLDARGLAFEFEADTTERAVQLDPGDAPFAWLKAALAAEDPEQRRERRRSYYRPATAL